MNSNAGGRNRKKQRASKGGGGRYTGKLRLAEEGEMYACVDSMVGNGRASVIGSDGHPYNCVIRQKFKGRHKRDNMMVKGTWCLVGVREWESRQKGVSVCDLLHVYRDSDVASIKKKETTNLGSLLATEDTIKSGNTDAVDDGIDFTNDVDMREQLTNTLLGCETEEVGVGVAEEGGDTVDIDDDEIDFDDI